MYVILTPALSNHTLKKSFGVWNLFGILICIGTNELLLPAWKVLTFVLISTHLYFRECLGNRYFPSGMPCALIAGMEYVFWGRASLKTLMITCRINRPVNRIGDTLI